MPCGPDAAYAITRRTGKRGTIYRLTSVASANPQTGEKSDTYTATQIRWMHKQPTEYSRLIRADATKQDVGDVTFIVWHPDVSTLTRLSQEDYIQWPATTGRRYEVVSTEIIETSFTITAREMVKQGD